MFGHAQHRYHIKLTVMAVFGLSLLGGCAGGDGGEAQAAMGPGDSLFSDSPGFIRPALDSVQPVVDFYTPAKESRAAAPRSAAEPSGPLLVVITYGNGCSATSPGNGLRDVADAIRQKYPRAQVITRGWNDDDDIRRTLEAHRGPLALIGHSFGGCRSIELAAQLRRSVDWLILLDPVPCNDWAFINPGKYFQLPAQARNAICFYRPAGMFPISYPLLSPPTSDTNRLRHLGHSEFCRDAEVCQCILDVCGRAQSTPDHARFLPALADVR